MTDDVEEGVAHAIGNFLAAQHRAISQTAFLDTLKKHQTETGKA